jgi:hypothetical protein
MTSTPPCRRTSTCPRLTPGVLGNVDSVGIKYFDRNPYFWKIDSAGNQLSPTAIARCVS